MSDTIIDDGEIELLDINETCRLLGGNRPISKPTLWRGIKAGRYPKPVELGPQVRRWVKHELHNVIRAKMNERAAAA